MQFESLCRSMLALVFAMGLAAYGFAGAKEVVVFSFGNSYDAPKHPSGTLVADSAGNLYGAVGGTMYKLSPPAEAGGEWTFTDICDCATGSPLIDKAGNLYYTADSLLFELSPPAKAGDAWTEKTLWYFKNAAGGLGASVFVLDENGSFWGTAYSGGSGTFCANGGTNGCGLLFHLVKRADGSWHENIAYNFGTYAGDAANPFSTISVRNHVISGTTFGGGTGGGTVFRLTVSGGVWKDTVLYDFPNYFYPQGLIEDPAGNLYGVGSNQAFAGEVFELSPPSAVGNPWTMNALYTFTGKGDGSYPNSPLWRDKLGDLFLTTGGGNWCEGGFRCGTAVKLKAPASSGGSWVLQVLHDFTGHGDGVLPTTGMIFVNGTFYGNTYWGGAAQAGTIYSVVP